MIKSNISIFIKHEYHIKRQFYVESTLVKHHIALEIASKNKTDVFFLSFYPARVITKQHNKRQGWSYRVVDDKIFVEGKVYKKKKILFIQIILKS